jgi:hypothetical protein
MCAEMAEIEVNRMKARDALARGDALQLDARVRASLLGQLWESMSGWDDRTLRRSFVHMQDASQARAFYVRFKVSLVLLG